ncbi:MAG: class I SAM-dependent methyltransferase, partial [Pseudomonadales bacterium]|nr:class I SAM-dependent methyltransferase [Pseudomonadales bacterium]
MYQALESAAQTFFGEAQPETRRIFHGRGHLFQGLEHLSVDWFSPLVLITSYQDIEDTNPLRDVMLNADRLGQIKGIMLQYRKKKGTPTEMLHGEPINHCIVEEHGLKYEIQPGINQNAGLFLDMRPMRAWLME